MTTPLRTLFATASRQAASYSDSDRLDLLQQAGVGTPTHLAQQAALLEVIGGTPAAEQSRSITLRVLVGTVHRWLDYTDSSTDANGHTTPILFPERLLPDVLLWDASLGYEDTDQINAPFIHPDTGPWLEEGDLGWLAYAAGVPYYEYVTSRPDRDALATLLGFVTTPAGKRVQAVLNARP